MLNKIIIGFCFIRVLNEFKAAHIYTINELEISHFNNK